MKIPILILKDTLDGLLTWVADNYDYYNDLHTPQYSWLYKTFNGNLNGNFNYYDQLVGIVTRGDENSQKLETRLMFDASRANLPTVHIHMPGEAKGSFTAINASIGFGDITPEETIPGRMARSSTATYDLIITGSGSEEVIAIYELLFALFIAAHDTIQNSFEVFEFTGNELMANQDIIPYNTFYRALRVNVSHERVVDSIALKSTFESVDFEGEMTL